MAESDHAHPRLGTHTQFFSIGDSLPTKTDLRFGMPPVWDQGTLGCSAAYACSAAFAYASKNAMKPSQLFLYYNERLMSGDVGKDQCGSLWDTVRAMRLFGMCPYGEWPSDMPFTEKPEHSCYVRARNHELISVSKVAPSIQSIRGALVLDYPVVIAINIYESFDTTSVANSGMVPVPDTDKEKLMGTHAVCLVGYTQYDCFVVRNSWGQSWGLAGYCMMPFDYLENPKLVASDAIILTAVCSVPTSLKRQREEEEKEEGEEPEAKKPK
jgi:C1A family cysteine protease